MTQTYLILIGAWTMFGCMAFIALRARKRSRVIDRLLDDARRQRGEK